MRIHQEKRQAQRLRFSQPVQCQYIDTGPVQGTLSADISRGGICIKSSDFVPLHTKLALSIQLAQNRVLGCRGEIVRIEKVPFGDQYKFGVRFDDVDLKALEKSNVI